MPEFLPKKEEELTAFLTGKKTRHDGTVYDLVKNTCFLRLSRKLKNKGVVRMCCGAMPCVDIVHHGPVVGINIVVILKEKTVP